MQNELNIRHMHQFKYLNLRNGKLAHFYFVTRRECVLFLCLISQEILFELNLFFKLSIKSAALGLKGSVMPKNSRVVVHVVSYVDARLRRLC